MATSPGGTVASPPVSMSRPASTARWDMGGVPGCTTGGVLP